MKILVTYNERRVWGGEDLVVEVTEDLLRRSGHDVMSWRKDNAALDDSMRGKVGAFVGGIYSLRARSEAFSRVRADRPDIVHAHNLYPGFSPSIIGIFKRARIPFVLHCHSYFLSCPIASHFRDGNVCFECVEHDESRAVRNNCRGSLAESVGYALRSAVARRSGTFRQDVDALIAPSPFLKQHLIDCGFAEPRIHVIENPVPIPESPAVPNLGRYVGFLGRLSNDKGVQLLVDAAAACPDIPVHIAGEGPLGAMLAKRAPPNVKLVGFVSGGAKDAFLRGARAMIVPSIAYETFCLSAAEAMAYGIPVVASRRSAPGDLVEPHSTGLLFAPEDVADLALKLRQLWSDPGACMRLGAEGRRIASRRFAAATYVGKLEALYNDLVRNHEQEMQSA